MAFNILTLRTAEHEDGAMYPVIGGALLPIELEDLDGSKTVTVVATALDVSEVGATLKTVARIKDVKAELIITDSRVAVACTKYDKGGGWVGFGGMAPIVSLGLNAASKARAAHRRKGKMLVGHVRYAWMRSVGCEAKTGFTSVEAVRFGLVEKAGDRQRHLVLTATLPKNVSAAKIAREITQRSARYRLAHTKINDDNGERAKLEALCAAEPLVTQPKKFVSYNFPTYFFANRNTAYPAGSTSGRRGD